MESKIKKLIFDILEVVILAMIISFLLIKFVFISVEVEGTSMVPTLSDRDRGISFVITKNISVNRFDIVVVDVGKLIVKRVIGMPNETIEYKDNTLYIDGVKYDEPYLKDVKTGDFKVKLNSDEYYCLGDNREVSKDSRVYGPFTIEDFKATHVLVITPFSNFGFKK